MVTSAIVARDVSKSFGDVDALNGARARRPRGRVLRPARPVRRGQDHDAARHRRAREARHGHVSPHRHRRHEGHPGRARPGDGLPELRAVPEADRGREHRVAAAGAASCPRPRSTRRSSASRSCCTSSTCSTASPAQMSGGEMQRVALGRALVREPRAFLMDEPLTNLDLKLRVEMRTELTRIHRSLGRTFLYVTNDQVEAMSMADQVAVLRAGHRPAGRHADRDLRPPGQPLGGDVRRLAADEPARRARPTGGSRARAGRCRNPGFGVAERPPARCSACAPRTCRSTCATSRRRWTARSTPSSRSATARWSTSRSAAQRVVIKAPPTTVVQIGEQVRAAVDLDRVHLFDAESRSRRSHGR